MRTYAKTWDFKLQSSQQLKLVVKVNSFNKPGETPASGCVAIMFGFKIKKKKNHIIVNHVGTLHATSLHFDVICVFFTSFGAKISACIRFFTFSQIFRLSLQKQPGPRLHHLPVPGQ